MRCVFFAGFSFAEETSGILKKSFSGNCPSFADTNSGQKLQVAQHCGLFGSFRLPNMDIEKKEILPMVPKDMLHKLMCVSSQITKYLLHMHAAENFDTWFRFSTCQISPLKLVILPIKVNMSPTLSNLFVKTVIKTSQNVVNYIPDNLWQIAYCL